MVDLLKKLLLQKDMDADFSSRLEKIYAGMDDAYHRAADRYGFDCRGCRDNCCMTRFYHHTYLEYMYLLKGLDTLEDAVRKTVTEKAADYCTAMDQAVNDDEKPFRFMCPLNMNGLCLLYDYRPMICRLHGIPHELRRPGQAPVMGPGCEAFTLQCRDMAYVTFDRTPFYMEMSKAEYDLKQALGIQDKFRKTIAQMILDGQN